MGKGGSREQKQATTGSEPAESPTGNGLFEDLVTEASRDISRQVGSDAALAPLLNFVSRAALFAEFDVNGSGRKAPPDAAAARERESEPRDEPAGDAPSPTTAAVAAATEPAPDPPAGDETTTTWSQLTPIVEMQPEGDSVDASMAQPRSLTQEAAAGLIMGNQDDAAQKLDAPGADRGAGAGLAADQAAAGRRIHLAADDPPPDASDGDGLISGQSAEDVRESFAMAAQMLAAAAAKSREPETAPQSEAPPWFDVAEADDDPAETLAEAPSLAERAEEEAPSLAERVEEEAPSVAERAEEEAPSVADRVEEKEDGEEDVLAALAADPAAALSSHEPPPELSIDPDRESPPPGMSSLSVPAAQAPSQPADAEPPTLEAAVRLSEEEQEAQATAADEARRMAEDDTRPRSVMPRDRSVAEAAPGPKIPLKLPSLNPREVSPLSARGRRIAAKVGPQAYGVSVVPMRRGHRPWLFRAAIVGVPIAIFAGGGLIGWLSYPSEVSEPAVAQTAPEAPAAASADLAAAPAEPREATAATTAATPTAEVAISLAEPQRPADDGAGARMAAAAPAVAAADQPAADSGNPAGTPDDAPAAPDPASMRAPETIASAPAPNPVTAGMAPGPALQEQRLAGPATTAAPTPATPQVAMVQPPKAAAPPSAPAQAVPPNMPVVRLSVADASGAAGVPIPLAISTTPDTVQHLKQSDAVRVAGVPEGLRLSAGKANPDGSWTLTPAELSGLMLNTPAGYQGDFTLTVAMMKGGPGAAAGAAESLSVKVAAPNAELTWLMARGDRFLSLGDVVAARLIFERAASRGSARAATAVGMTHDPVVHRQLGVRGPQPNPQAATEWYKTGLARGDREAESRLVALQEWLSGSGSTPAR